jgi:hypothetical protein
MFYMVFQEYCESTVSTLSFSRLLCASASDHIDPPQPSASSAAPTLLTASAIKARLTLWSRALLESMPDFMQHELLMSRVDGVFNFSQVLFFVFRMMLK